jgi:hypothetical protein
MSPGVDTNGWTDVHGTYTATGSGSMTGEQGTGTHTTTMPSGGEWQHTTNYTQGSSMPVEGKTHRMCFEFDSERITFNQYPCSEEDNSYDLHDTKNRPYIYSPEEVERID